MGEVLKTFDHRMLGICNFSRKCLVELDGKLVGWDLVRDPMDSAENESHLGTCGLQSLLPIG